MKFSSVISGHGIPWLLLVLALLVLQQFLECHTAAHIPEGQQSRAQVSHKGENFKNIQDTKCESLTKEIMIPNTSVMMVVQQTYVNSLFI